MSKKNEINNGVVTVIFIISCVVGCTASSTVGVVTFFVLFMFACSSRMIR